MACSSSISSSSSCEPNPPALKQPCSPSMQVPAPSSFALTFPTQYGPFTASCYRELAPSQVDRVYNLALNGYYNDNYFMRVINSTSLEIIQFGTNGDPSISQKYNWNSTKLSPCGIILPQPPSMSYQTNLSNTFGSLSMSTSYNDTTATTWNATAELFINTGNNSRLDSMLFVPICTIDEPGMLNVLKFPTVGELTELGGSGVSLTKLYEEGNSYITQNPSWSDLAISSDVSVSCLTVDCPCFSSPSPTPAAPSQSFSDVLFPPLSLFLVVLICSTVSLVSLLRNNERIRNRWNRWQWQRLAEEENPS